MDQLAIDAVTDVRAAFVGSFLPDWIVIPGTPFDIALTCLRLRADASPLLLLTANQPALDLLARHSTGGGHLHSVCRRLHFSKIHSTSWNFSFDPGRTDRHILHADLVVFISLAGQDLVAIALSVGAGYLSHLVWMRFMRR